MIIKDVKQLNGSEREMFDRIMMGGSLGTQATPYAEWLKMSKPYSVEQITDAKLGQIINTIIMEPSDSGYMTLIPSETDFYSAINLAYKDGKVILSKFFADYLEEEDAEILFMEERAENKNWVIKVPGLRTHFKNRFIMNPTLNSSR